jgi:predicted secreted protein
MNRNSFQRWAGRIAGYCLALLFAFAGAPIPVAALTEQRGIDVKLYVMTAPSTYTLVGALRSVSLTINGEVIDASHAGSGAWRNRLAGMKDWSISGGTVLLMDLTADGFDPAFSALKTAAQGTTLGSNVIGVQILYPDGSKDTGTAIISEFGLEAPHDDVAEGSVTLDGNGPLTFTAAPS